MELVTDTASRSSIESRQVHGRGILSVASYPHGRPEFRGRIACPTGTPSPFQQLSRPIHRIEVDGAV